MTANTSSEPEPAAGEQRRADPLRLAPRFGTILWGMLVLAFALVVGGVRGGHAVPDPIAFITGALILGGLALVAVGITAALRRAD